MEGRLGMVKRAGKVGRALDKPGRLVGLLDSLDMSSLDDQCPSLQLGQLSQPVYPGWAGLWQLVYEGGEMV